MAGFKCLSFCNYHELSIEHTMVYVCVCVFFLDYFCHKSLQQLKQQKAVKTKKRKTNSSCFVRYLKQEGRGTHNIQATNKYYLNFNGFY